VNTLFFRDHCSDRNTKQTVGGTHCYTHGWRRNHWVRLTQSLLLWVFVMVLHWLGGRSWWRWGWWSCFRSDQYRLHQQLLPTFTTVHAGGRRNSIYSNPSGVDDVQKYTQSTKYTRGVVGMNATIMTNQRERFVDTNIIH
jgi:hypothetical protein